MDDLDKVGCIFPGSVFTPMAMVKVGYISFNCEIHILKMTRANIIQRS